MNERRMFHAGALLLLAALFSGASAVSVADHDLPGAQRWHDDQLRERQQRELERRQDELERQQDELERRQDELERQQRELERRQDELERRQRERERRDAFEQLLPRR